MLIVLLGIALYLVKVLASPHAFGFSDEFTHWRNTQNILRTHHLFALNPLLPTAAYYPGLAALTAGVVTVTGISVFAAGLLVIGLARIVLCASLFLVAERVVGSSRMAAGAVLVYAANPMFLFWSAAFSYENLALPMAAFLVWWIGKSRLAPGVSRMLVAAVGIAAVVITHHVVGFALAALLAAWWLAECVNRHAVTPRWYVGLFALLTASSAFLWFFLVARPAPGYLISQNLLPALRQTGSLLLGHVAPRRLYASAGLTPPQWEPVAGFTAALVLLGALPAAIRRAWPLRHRRPLIVAAVVAAAYPASLIPRLAPSGVAISARSAEYVFAGLGCLLALLVVEPALRRARDPSLATRWPRGRSRALVAALLATVVFVGNVTVGTAFYQRLPEASRPRGYPWSVGAGVIAASAWARTHLGINRRFAANKIDSYALATYGEQDPLNTDLIWPVFFSRSINATVENRIEAAHVRYVLTDWRMTDGVPPTPGYYVSPNEPGAGKYRQMFPRKDLAKFDSAPCARLIYRSGPVQIFDVSQIEQGHCRRRGRLTHTKGT